MRAFETLLLFFVLLSLVILSIRSPPLARWKRLAPFMALTMALAQWLVEGPRWQMVPAYALTVLLVLVSLRAADASGGSPPGTRVGRRLVVGSAALALAAAVALPIVLPVFRFPQPTGPYAIGTLTYHWTDPSRSEVLAAGPERRRQLMVQVWYPAKPSPSAARVAYMADASDVLAAFAHIHRLPAFVLGHIKSVTTNAVSAAAAAEDQLHYPVLLFLEGATGYRQMNTFQVEELVSHGYIIAAIDQPGAAANVVFPDGHQLPGLNLAQFQATVRPSYLPDLQASTPRAVVLPNGSALKDGSIVPYLAQDVLFALDRLALLNRSDPRGVLTGKLDLQRVGAFGLSLGGIVVGEACHLEARLRACLVMDAPMSTAVVKAGLRQPSLWITRDVASMRLERQRAGGWPEAEIEAHLSSMRAVYDGLSGAGYFVQVPGMFHSNFTDIPSWTPLASWLGITGPIDALRAHEIVNAYSLAFFDRHLRGRPAELLDGPVILYPEVRFEAKRRP